MSDRLNDFNTLCRSLIEESIQSLANQGACKIPNLPVDSPEMLSFLKDEPPVECGNENDDWVACHVSVDYIFSTLLHFLKFSNLPEIHLHHQTGSGQGGGQDHVRLCRHHPDR